MNHELRIYYQTLSNRYRMVWHLNAGIQKSIQKHSFDQRAQRIVELQSLKPLSALQISEMSSKVFSFFMTDSNNSVLRCLKHIFYIIPKQKQTNKQQKKKKTFI